MRNKKYRGPVVLAVLDGVGLASPATNPAGNAVALARTEFLDRAVKNYPRIALEASGEAVGILKGQMGNSEVGHNALGSGQQLKQGIAKIEEAFATGEIFRSSVWRDIADRVLKNNSTLHFAGIFSDGGVHSDINHLERMIKQAYTEGIRRIRVHAVFDGRDVEPQAEPKYINRLEEFFKNFPDADFKISSGVGRMVGVADRYENDWEMVKHGWDMMVHGFAPRFFKSATEAISTLRAENPEIQDQYLPAFVLTDENDQPLGPVRDGDAFVYFDFRADRAIEIAMAFTYNDFPFFDRKLRPDVYFAGLTEYNSDTHVPEHQLVPPIKIEQPLNQFLAKNGVSQLAVSETVKFGHITYYFNGNSRQKAEKEEWIEIPSDTLPFDTRPWMKSAEITDAVLENLDQFDFVRLNFPGGDMVGHFAELEPTITALEAIDIQLARIAEKVDELGGILVVTADHGNAEELLDENGKPKTAHSLNPVPCIFYDNTKNSEIYRLASLEAPAITNLAATIAFLLGLETPPATWHPSLLENTPSNA